MTFSFSAAGYLEGTVSLAGRVHAARRTDGDGNGFLTDAQDRLWIDSNDDGRWDASLEQFLFYRFFRSAMIDLPFARMSWVPGLCSSESTAPGLRS